MASTDRLGQIADTETLRKNALQALELMVTFSPLATFLRESEPTKAILPYQFGSARHDSSNRAHGLARVDWTKATRDEESEGLKDCGISCATVGKQMDQAKKLAEEMRKYLKRKGIVLLSKQRTVVMSFPTRRLTRERQRANERKAVFKFGFWH